MLGPSGEGAEQIERSVSAAARGLGGTASLALLPDAATVAVTSHGRSSTVVVRAFPEVFRMDQVAALKPFLHEVAAGRLDLEQAGRRLTSITGSPPPYPWWAKLTGIVLFSVGFAPLMQPTWYEVGSTAVLATVAACLVVAADRLPRLAKVLPLIVAVTVSVLTLEVFARTGARRSGLPSCWAGPPPGSRAARISRRASFAYCQASSR
ncbi:threonine/serine exporter family protein [Streptomyces sp. NPDC048428]|uniref:threonine/serine exporter family protein n=1 Tax=Streptomyces sp. NPDC048428 TaxID=3154503 RepID=UPI0034427B0B